MRPLFSLDIIVGGLTSLLTNALEKAGLLDQFSKLIDGYCDTLLVLRTTLPKEPSYSLPNLYQSLCGSSLANAHDAMADVEALIAVVAKAKLELHKTACTFQSAKDKIVYDRECQRRRSSLQELVAKKVLSKGMADKVAASGLAIEHLVLAHRRNTEKGIEILFSEKVHGARRVTASKKIIQSVTQYMLTCSHSS